jgi:hypothetical protein
VPGYSSETLGAVPFGAPGVPFFDARSGALGYVASMDDEKAPAVTDIGMRDTADPDSVVIRTGPAGAIARAAGAATTLAAVAVITATVTMLNVSAADDIGDAKVSSSRGFNDLEEIRWVAGTRLIIAVVALVIAILGGIRYSRDLPATRYTFSADGEEATESIEGTAARGWVTLLIGAGVVISTLAIVLNAVALAFALHLHESPNFGVPTG